MRKGNKPTYEEFLKTVNPDFRDTTYYNLREAYNELPYETLKGWASNPDQNHLPDTYKLPGHPTFSVESKYYKPGMKAGYWEGEKYVPIEEGKLPPGLLSIKDTRLTDLVNGQKIGDKNNLSITADSELVKKIVAEAKRQDIDPYTALAMAMQESNIGGEFKYMGSTANNPFALTKYYNKDGKMTNMTNDWREPDFIRASMDILKEKAEYAKKLGKKSEAEIIQAWNGYGKLGTKMDESTGHTSWYGLSVDKNNPLDLNKNPVYGNRVIDIRDNILKNNPDIKAIIDSTQAPLPTGTSLLNFNVTDSSMKKKTAIPKLEDGGVMTGMDPASYLAMSEAERHAYFITIPDAQKQAFVQAVQNYEAQRMAEPTVPLSPRRNDPAAAIANIPARRPMLPVTQPLPAAGMRPRRDILAEMKTIQPSETIAKTPSEKYKPDFGDLSTVGTVASSFIDQANMANPAQTEIAPSAIAGGVSGLISGGPLGALIGGIGGALKAGNQREGYEEQEFRRKRNMLTGLRVAPSIQETGGLVEEDVDIDIPVQEEKGELMLFPDGKLVDSMATETHKEMDKDDVTDFLPSGTMVFSNSKKRIINLADIADDIFTVTKGHYSEDGNEPGETILMGAIYGKNGKKTPAEMARKVRKDFPVIEKPVEQIEIRTNKENLRRRAELLLPIMQLQEKVYKKFEFEKPVKYEKGGIVKKMKIGGPIMDPAKWLELKTKEERDAYIASLPEVERSPFMDSVYNYTVDQSKGLGVTLAPKAQPVVPDLGALGAIGVGVAPVAPAIPDLSGLRRGVGAAAAPTVPTPPSLPDSVLNSADPILSDQAEQIDSDYASSVAGAQDLYRSQRLRNVGILAAKLGGISMQNPEVTPVTQGTEFVDEMFPSITESQIQSQTNAARNSQNRTLSVINNSDLPGSRLGAAIASTQARLLENENQVRTHALDVNQSQRAKRYERLNSILNLNRTSEVNAENDTRSNRNQLISNIGDVAAQNIKDQGGLKESLSSRLEELKKWRAENKGLVTQAQYENMVKKEERKFKKEDNLRMLDIVSKYMTEHYG